MTKKRLAEIKLLNTHAYLDGTLKLDDIRCELEHALEDEMVRRGAADGLLDDSERRLETARKRITDLVDLQSALVEGMRAAVLKICPWCGRRDPLQGDTHIYFLPHPFPPDECRERCAAIDERALLERVDAEVKKSLPTIEEMSGLVEDFTAGRSLKQYLEELDD